MGAGPELGPHSPPGPPAFTSPQHSLRAVHSQGVSLVHTHTRVQGTKRCYLPAGIERTCYLLSAHGLPQPHSNHPQWIHVGDTSDLSQSLGTNVRAHLPLPDPVLPSKAGFPVPPALGAHLVHSHQFPGARDGVILGKPGEQR